MKKLAAISIDDSTINVPESLKHLSGGLTSGVNILQTGITVFIIVMVIIAVFITIYSGIQWITSQGDKQKVQAARNRLTFAIVGLIIIFLTYFIIGFIGNVFGINLLNISVRPNVTAGVTEGCFDEYAKSGGSGGIAFCGLVSQYSGEDLERLIDVFPAATQEESRAACYRLCCDRVKTKHGLPADTRCQ